MVRRPEPTASPYFFCSAFPAAAMVISSGQSSPSDTLDSGTCSDLDGSTPPPLPKKGGAAAAAAAAATVTVTVNGARPHHRRTASLTSSGNDADSDEDAGSNISCDSLNGHDPLDPMQSIQEEKGGDTLKSVALTVRANNLVNHPVTAPVAPLVAATAAAVVANGSFGAPSNSFAATNGSFGAAKNSFGASNSSFGALNSFGASDSSFGALNSFGTSDSSFSALKNSLRTSDSSFSTFKNSFGASDSSFGALKNSFGASDSSFDALNNSFGASDNSFGALNNSFGASNNSFGASNNSLNASDSSFGAPDTSVSATVNGTSTNVVTFNGPVVHSANGAPKPPPPKTPAKPAKAIPSPPTPPKTPTSPTAHKTFLPQGLLQDIRERSAALAAPSPPKLRTWGEAAPAPAPPKAPDFPKQPSALYRILQPDAVTADVPRAPAGIVRERTYEERAREITAEAQTAAAAAQPRARAGSYKYEEDRFYQFHLNEREPEPEDARATRANEDHDEEEEETFAGLKDVLGRKEGSATIRSAKGTVRGVKNRVRAGIATFLHLPDAKNYKEKEAGKVVLYVTTMGVVRHTFQECLKVKKILRTLLVKYDERDAFMSREVQNELRERMHSDEIMVPQLFVDGQHIGDAETIERLNETGELRKMLKPFKSPDVCNTCQVCGGFRLLPCSICNGSKKSMHRNDFTAEFVALKCMSCDEVGLVKCHAC